MASKKKKKQSGPPKKKINIEAMLPKPKPIKLMGPSYYIKHGREYPFEGCWVKEDWREGGLTPVVFARRQTEDRVIYAVILTDLYLLGAKNAYANGDFPAKKFYGNLPKMCVGEPEPIEVGLAHELVYGAIDFARKYGFEPHEDFRLASMVLDPPEAHPPQHNLEFGYKGKPMYISGPYDNQNQILSRLRRTAGEDKYDFLVGSEYPGLIPGTDEETEELVLEGWDEVETGGLNVIDWNEEEEDE